MNELFTMTNAIEEGTEYIKFIETMDDCEDNFNYDANQNILNKNILNNNNYQITVYNNEKAKNKINIPVQSLIDHVESVFENKIDSDSNVEDYPLDLRTNAAKLREKEWTLEREMTESNNFNMHCKSHVQTNNSMQDLAKNKCQQQYTHAISRNNIKIPNNTTDYHQIGFLKNVCDNTERMKETTSYESQNANLARENNIPCSLNAKLTSLFMNINIAFPGFDPFGHLPYHWPNNNAAAIINEVSENKERFQTEFTQSSQFMFGYTVHNSVSSAHTIKAVGQQMEISKGTTNFHTSINCDKLCAAAQYLRLSEENTENSVFIGKEKQRRYRTDRPFACELCSARFTLSANMKRHMKRQHHQLSSQHQENKNNNTGRCSTNLSEATFSVINIEDKNNPLQLQNSVINNSENFNQITAHCQKYLSSFDPSKEFLSGEDKNNKLQKVKHMGLVTEDYECNDDDENDFLIIDEDRNASRNIEDEDKAVSDLANMDQLSDSAKLQDCVFMKYLKVIYSKDNEDVRREKCKEEERHESIDIENSSVTAEDTVESHATMLNQEKKSAYELAPYRVACPYCFRKFPWTSSLCRHITTHTKEKYFKCPNCPSSYTTKSNLDRHSLKKHSINYTVNKSSNTKTNSVSVSNSSSIMTPKKNHKKSITRPYRCNLCSMSTFSTQDNLNRHMITKHNNSFNPYGYTLSINEVDIISKPDNFSDHQSCTNICEYQEVNMSDIQVKPLAENSSSVTQSCESSVVNSQFKCHWCKESYTEMNEALKHIREIHLAEFALLTTALESVNVGNSKIANDTVSVLSQGSEDQDIGQLRELVLPHTQRKALCEICLRRFWSVEDLRRHVRTHTGERPFSCDICDKDFTLKHSMLRHRKKHHN